MELVTIGGATIGRATWNRVAVVHHRPADRKDKELRGTSLPVSRGGNPEGRDGRRTELECKPGDVSLVPSGHDAWVVGNETVVIVDFQGMGGVRKRGPPDRSGKHV